MAVTKTKRSVHPSKAVMRNDRVTSTRHLERGKPAERKNEIRSTSEPSTKTLRRRPRPTTTSNKLRFPEAKGRVVEFIEFFSDPSSNSLHLRFQDNTSLTFDFATSFATEAFFSRWKAGNERVLRYWPRLHPEPVF